MRRAGLPLQRLDRSSRRGGTSLVEILAALLVFSIGVVSVMTLFPISILRSAQGAQLTNATILKLRAEAIVDMFQLTSDRFIPQPAESFQTNCLIDPLGWQDLSTEVAPVAFGTALAQQYGVVPAGPSVNPQSYAPPPRQGPTRFININTPPGVQLLRDQNPTPLRRLGFGALLPIPLQGGVPYSTAAAGVFPTRDAALAAVTLPDTFETLFAAQPVSLASTATQTVIQFDPALDMTYVEHLMAPAQRLLLPGSRVVMFSLDGKESQFRVDPGDASVIQVNSTTQTITVTPRLPGTPNFALLSEVRIETPEARYSWMITVRKKGIAGGSITELDCVVFFNRASNDPEEELLHACTIPAPAGSDPNIPAVDAAYSGTMLFNTYPSDPARKPVLKRGSWVFDPQHAEWYRVQNLLNEAAGGATVRLDRQPTETITQLTVPRGVIHVFPMKTRVDNQGLHSARRAR
jgi:hypothetical protein